MSEQKPSPEELQESASRELIRALEQYHGAMKLLVNGIQLAVACMQAFTIKLQQREGQLEAAYKAHQTMAETAKNAEKRNMMPERESD